MSIIIKKIGRIFWKFFSGCTALGAGGSVEVMVAAQSVVIVLTCQHVIELSVEDCRH